MNKRILIVEDEKNIVDILSFNLSKEGYETLEAYDGEAGLQLALEQNPDLILLDLMLPKMNGFDVCRSLRRENRSTPVIMLTAREEETDKVLGLDAGADDYVAKPFGMMELLSRIRAVLRRASSQPVQTQEGAVLQFGRLTLDPVRHLVQLDGKEVNLTLKEFAVLHLLMARHGAVITRDELLQKVWGYDYGGETRTVDVHVGTLRQKLGDCSGYVETVRGIGYRLGGLGK